MKNPELMDLSRRLGRAGPLQLPCFHVTELREMRSDADFPDRKRKEKKKAFLTSQESPATDVFLSVVPKGPGRQRKFYLADQSIQVLVSFRGNIFYV